MEKMSVERLNELISILMGCSGTCSNCNKECIKNGKKKKNTARKQGSKVLILY